MTTVAISLYASGWPEHVRAHPWLIIATGAIGILLMAYGWFVGAPSVKNGVDQSIRAGKNNSGSNIGRDHQSAGRDLHVGDNYYQVPAKPEEIPKQQASVNDPAGKLTIVRLERTLVIQWPDIWHEDHTSLDGKWVWVARVENSVRRSLCRVRRRKSAIYKG